MRSVLLIFIMLIFSACCDKEKEEARLAAAAKNKELEEYKAAMRYQAFNALYHYYNWIECNYDAYEYGPVPEVPGQRNGYALAIRCYVTALSVSSQIDTLKKVDPGFPQYVCNNFSIDNDNIVVKNYYYLNRFKKIHRCYLEQYPDGYFGPASGKKQQKIAECVGKIRDTDDDLRKAAEEQVRARCAQTATQGGGR